MAASYSQPPASEWQFKEQHRDCPTCGTRFLVKGTMHRYCSFKCNPSRHPDRLNAALRRSRLKRKYGLTEADFDRMVSEQSGECAICGATDDRLVVDHDHWPSGVVMRSNQRLCARFRRTPRISSLKYLMSRPRQRSMLEDVSACRIHHLRVLFEKPNR